MSYWYLRRPVAGSGLVEAVGVLSDEHPDGAVVEGPPAGPTDPPRPPGALAVARFDPDVGMVVELWVSPTASPKAPPMWFVTHSEPQARPPALSLVAFPVGQRPDGAVVDPDTFRSMPVRSDDQLAAVRWWPGTGQLHQAYVAPAHRRRGIMLKLVHAVGVYAVVSGWPRVWAGGNRTDLGEQFVRNTSEVVRSRVLPRTEVAPPMTPGLTGHRRRDP